MDTPKKGNFDKEKKLSRLSSTASRHLIFSLGWFYCSFTGQQVFFLGNMVIHHQI
jgi:hypothetical protein